MVNSPASDLAVQYTLHGITPPSQPHKPEIMLINGVVSGTFFQPGFTPGSWISIFGDNLASTTRIWDSSKIVEPLFITLNRADGKHQSYPPLGFEQLRVCVCALNDVGTNASRTVVDAQRCRVSSGLYGLVPGARSHIQRCITGGR